VSDDAALHQQADALLRAGGIIGILMDDKESMKEQVAAARKANHAQVIHLG
jgi:hypothetical protein